MHGSGHIYPRIGRGENDNGDLKEGRILIRDLYAPKGNKGTGEAHRESGRHLSSPRERKMVRGLAKPDRKSPPEPEETVGGKQRGGMGRRPSLR